ncbi:hypothetical protein M1466_00295 [Candidatus Dependentiae bacterium]|nr:hypothetical protein [Candidatus Dependentiae bacterium]
MKKIILFLPLLAYAIVYGITVQVPSMAELEQRLASSESEAIKDVAQQFAASLAEQQLVSTVQEIGDIVLPIDTIIIHNYPHLAQWAPTIIVLLLQDDPPAIAYLFENNFLSRDRQYYSPAAQRVVGCYLR